MSLVFRICPRCGLRNAVRRTRNVSETFCAQCDGPPTVPGFNVQVHGLSRGVGQPAVHYRLRILDLDGEVVFSEEGMSRDDARNMALRVSRNIIAFLESVGR